MVDMIVYLFYNPMNSVIVGTILGIGQWSPCPMGYGKDTWKKDLVDPWKVDLVNYICVFQAFFLSWVSKWDSYECER